MAIVAAALTATAAAPAVADQNDGVSGSSSESAVKIFDTDGTWATCHDPFIERPFAPFGDQRDYVLAPGGAFEDPAAPGWQFSGGARLVSGDDPFGLRAGKSVLRLPDDGTAITPAMCVDLHYPTLRFAARTAEDGRLKVEIIYPDVPGATFREVSRIDAEKEEWILSDDVPLLPETGGVEPGERRVALRFSARGDASSWRVDDVFVDPRYY